MSHYRQPMPVREIISYWKVTKGAGRVYMLERRLRVLKDQRESFAKELRAFDEAIEKDKKRLIKARGGKKKRGIA